jgi:hypothetical protein
MTCRCIKTGCQIYSTEYGTYLRGDAHEVGEMIVFRTAEHQSYEPIQDVLHYEVHKIEQWWQDKPYGTMLANRMFVTSHGYDGKKIEETGLPL